MNIEIEQLTHALREAMPVTSRLWDLETVAAYLSVSKSKAGRYAARPDFPKAIRLPTGGRGTPRYRPQEVIDWANEFTEAN